MSFSKGLSSGPAILIIMMIVGYGEALLRDDAFVGYSERHILLPSIPAPQSQLQEYLVFTTDFGEIKVKLATSAAPATVSFIKDLVQKKAYDGCGFYRAEPAGETFDRGSIASRKGYALVQGGLYSCGRQQEVHLPLEVNLQNKKGTVSLITGTSEFFFNLDDHLDWDGSFAVWGEVASFASLEVLQKIATLSTRQEVHSSGTVMRILLQEVKYHIRME